jgi:hypothetical protein
MEFKVQNTANPLASAVKRHKLKASPAVKLDFRMMPAFFAMRIHATEMAKPPKAFMIGETPGQMIWQSVLLAKSTNPMVIHSNAPTQADRSRTEASARGVEGATSEVVPGEIFIYLFLPILSSS